MPGHTKSAAPVTQNHLSEPEDLMLQNATPSQEISAPDLLTSLMNMSDGNVSCTALATRNPFLQILFKCPTPAIGFGHATKPSRFCSLLSGWRIPCACHTKRRFNAQKRHEHVVFCTF